MDLDLPALHRKALDATSTIVAGVRPEQYDLPTPCEGWDVRELLSHIVYGNRWVAPLVEGKTIDEVGDALEGDQLGDDHASAYRASAADADAAFSQDGAMQRPVAVSYGPVPGEVYCGHRFVDVVVHGWDLAKATGQDTTLDDDLVAGAWATLEPQLAPLQASGAFGTSHDIPEGADPQTALLAALGRHP